MSGNPVDQLLNNVGSYEGEYRDGKYHGQGIYSYPDGSMYEGKWKDGEKHGQGILNFTWWEQICGEIQEWSISW
jgi:MORN repeat.